MPQGTIVKVAGPLIVAEHMADARMYDVVRVSKHRLVGEMIELRGDRASIQVYEETSGLGPGEPVEIHGRAAVGGTGAGPDRIHLRRHPAPADGHPRKGGRPHHPRRGSALAGPGKEMGFRAEGEAGRQGNAGRHSGHRAGKRGGGAPHHGARGRIRRSGAASPQATLPLPKRFAP